nr:uncharacterized protein LOC123747022 isoform X2 [Procambarus clarkii]
MLVPRVDVGGGADGDDHEHQQGVASMLCNCHTETDSMTDTQLTVLCQANVTCTNLNVQPGATIVSPILLSLSGVTGQIWALYYLYTTTRPQHSRTVFFVLLSTLIWTDLIGKVLTTAPALVAYVHGRWVGGVPLCNFHGFSMMLISLVTHLLVSTMAVERFIGIRHGYFYNKNITTSRTKLLLLSIWLFSALFCALPLFGLGQYGLQYPGSWCFVNIHVSSNSPLHHRIYTNVFGVFTIVNLLIMVFCNIVVIIVLLEKAMYRRGNLCEATLLCLRLCRQRCSGSSFCAPHRTYKQRELEMQMVIVLLVITIVFIISWTPIDLRLFLNQIWPHKTREDHIQDMIAVRLTSINQIVDPWAYIICRKVFATRAWRWMRLSFMGSRLLARDSSSHPGGSHKKLSKTIKPPEKIQYKTPFKGGDNGVTQERDNKAMVVVVEGDALLNTGPRTPIKDSPDTPGPASKDGPASVAEGEQVVGVTLDPSSAHRTPHVALSGSEHTTYATALQAGLDLTTLAVVPIPVFTSEQYSVRQLVEPCHHPNHHSYTNHHSHSTNHHPRLRRLASSASAKDSSTSRQPRRAHEYEGVTPADSWASASAVLGRRHSWCCPQASLHTKYYRTQNTQTFVSSHASPSQGDDNALHTQRNDHAHRTIEDDHTQEIDHTASDACPYHHHHHQTSSGSCVCTNPYGTGTYPAHYTSAPLTHNTTPSHTRYTHQQDKHTASHQTSTFPYHNQNLQCNPTRRDPDNEVLHVDFNHTHTHHNSEPTTHFLSPHASTHLTNLDFCNFNSEGHFDRHKNSHTVGPDDINSVFVIGNSFIPWVDGPRSTESVNEGVLNSINSKPTLKRRGYKDLY